MAKNRHTVEQIIHKLREAEVALSEGKPLFKAVRKLGTVPMIRDLILGWLHEDGYSLGECG